MSEKPPSDRLAHLGEQLDKLQSARPPRGKAGGNPGLQQGLAMGFRIGVELITAVVVSTAVGWAIDRWLGTRPWVMLVMFFLGVAAGMLNVYRAVIGTGGAVGYPPPKSSEGGEERTRQSWDSKEE